MALVKGWNASLAPTSGDLQYTIWASIRSFGCCHFTPNLLTDGPLDSSGSHMIVIPFKHMHRFYAIRVRLLYCIAMALAASKSSELKGVVESL